MSENLNMLDEQIKLKARQMASNNSREMFLAIWNATPRSFDFQLPNWPTDELHESWLKVQAYLEKKYERQIAQDLLDKVIIEL